MEYFLIPIFAFLNRARGTKLYSMTDSTVIGRLVSMLAISLLTVSFFNGDLYTKLEACIFSLMTLMFWCSPAWDKYWGASIGTNNDLAMMNSAVGPIDWIMKKIWKGVPVGGIKMRLWGLVAMSLRQSLLMPWIATIAILSGHPDNLWMVVFAPFLGAIYFLVGLVRPLPKNDKQTDAIEISEYILGAAMGVLAIFSMGS